MGGPKPILTRLLSSLISYMLVEMSLNLSHSNNVFIVNHDPQAEPDSWPFLTPVSKEEVPDYYDVIKVRGVESDAGMYGELCLFCRTRAEGNTTA